MAQVGHLDSPLPGSTDVAQSTEVQPHPEQNNVDSQQNNVDLQQNNVDSQQNNVDSQNSKDSTAEPEPSENIQHGADQQPKMAQVGHLETTLPGSADVVPPTEVQPHPELGTDSQQNNVDSQVSNDPAAEPKTSETVQHVTSLEDQLPKVGSLGSTLPSSGDVVPSTDVHPELDSKQNNVDSQNSNDSATETKTSENEQQETSLQDKLPKIPKIGFADVTKMGIPSIPEFPSVGDKLTSLPKIGKMPRAGEAMVPSFKGMPKLPASLPNLQQSPAAKSAFTCAIL